MSLTPTRKYEFTKTCNRCGFSVPKLVEVEAYPYPNNIIAAQTQFIEEPTPGHAFHATGSWNVTTDDR